MDDSSCSPLKQCFKCKEFFPATRDYFYVKNRNKDRLKESCKTCCGGLNIGVPRLPEGYKRCPDCEKILPRSNEHFFANKGRPDGLDAYCKGCKHVRYIEACQSEEQGMKERPETQVCNKCGIEKPAMEVFFRRNPPSRYGLDTICRDCRSVRRVELYHRDPEKARAKQRRYALQCSLLAKSRYQINREQIRAKQKMLYADDPERIKVYQRRYNQSQRGRETLRVRNHRRRARKKAAPGVLTRQQIKDKLKAQRYRCYYSACGHAKFEKRNGEYVFHIEHTIPLSRTEANPRNDINYVVLACPSCNLKKWNRLPHEWPEGGRLF